MDRDCDKCVYHTSGSCSKWECDFTTVSDIRNKTLNDLWELAIGKYDEILSLGDLRKNIDQLKRG